MAEEDIKEPEKTPEQTALEEILAEDDAERVVITNLSEIKNPFASMIKSEEIRSKNAGKKIVRTREYREKLREKKLVGIEEISCIDTLEAY